MGMSAVDVPLAVRSGIELAAAEGEALEVAHAVQSQPATEDARMSREHWLGEVPLRECALGCARSSVGDDGNRSCGTAELPLTCGMAARVLAGGDSDLEQNERC